MCFTPIAIRNKKKSQDSQLDFLSVPCGKCPKCLNKRANSWIFRMLQEDRMHVNSLFVTLTYDNDSVPISKSGYMTLDKSDAQKFFKRLRKNTGRKSIRYYLCGEYGSQTFRPHYHAIVFDVSESEVRAAWRINGIDIGLVHVGDVSKNSIGYCVKYMNKGKLIPQHDRDDRVPEFALMSKKMGANYMTPSVVAWHKRPNNLKPYVVVPGGHKQAIPRYYKDKIFSDVEKKVIALQSSVKYDEEMQVAIDSAGSLENYIRIRNDRLRALFIEFRKNSQNRSKV